MDGNQEKPLKVEKTREEIEAERKMRKAAKAAKKVKPGGIPKGNDENKKPDSVNEEKQHKTKETEMVKEVSSENQSKEKGNNEKTGDVKGKKPKVEVKKGGDGNDRKQTENNMSTIKEVAKVNDTNVKAEEKGKNQKEGKVESPKVVEGEKSKAQLRAERRAIQEAQRAAKADKAQKGLPLKEKDSSKQPTTTKESNKQVKTVNNAIVKEVEGILKDKDKKDKKQKKSVTWTKPSFYGHLPVIGCGLGSGKGLSLTSEQNKSIDSSFLMLGLHFSNGIIVGGNARASALLYCLLKLVKGCLPSEGEKFSEEILTKINLNVKFLKQFRPFSVSMYNAAQYVRSKCRLFGEQNLPPEKLKEELVDAIETFIDVNITKARQSIALNLCDALQHDTSDKIFMTFGWSSTVATVFTEMKKSGRIFHVVVVDSPVRREGKTMARRLADEEIPCTLVSSEHVGFMMKYVHKVFIGCSALLVNSDILSRAGTSQVALVAKSHNIPVLACCEMYKCANRAQTDAFGVNEQGNPSALVGLDPPPTFSGLDLAYDITPASFITAVVTENGIYPCDAAKSILRLKQLDSDE